MSFGIVLCSRKSSSRVPNKPFRLINGIPAIVHLLNRLDQIGLPIILAVPTDDFAEYLKLDLFKNVQLFASNHSEDPLKRMHEAADLYGIKNVIRVTHDKIFVEKETVLNSINVYQNCGAEYLFGSEFIPGTGFEIISTDLLKKASEKFNNVEHISYAVRLLTNKQVDFCPVKYEEDHRFLIDFPEDLDFFNVLFSQVGNDASLADALLYLKNNPEIKEINKPPKVTFYTCAYNAEEFIQKAMNSIKIQSIFNDSEYIIIDDFSNDKTLELIAKFKQQFKNVRWIKNQKNLGLSSSSNIALKEARGQYIIRLDADDYFTSASGVSEMITYLEKYKLEALYPHNYFGKYGVIQKGKESNHVGGALFNTRALNFLKFTDDLRGYEGLDLFTRAKDKLKIGYFEKPVFFYTQREGSLSKTNLKEREELKRKIEAQNVK